MAPLPRSPRNQPSPQSAGFALVVVLAILAMLLVLVLSLSSVLHVETRSSASSKDLSLARQNALFGLEVALGQLQEYAGKDQAVTFPATTFYPPKGDPKNPAVGTLYRFYKDRAESGTPPFGARRTWMTHAKRGSSLNPASGTWESDLRNWWSGRNPRWVGIMDASLRRDNTPSNKFGEPKREQLPVWLVSGNEKFTISGNLTSYPSGYFTPNMTLPDPVDPNATGGSAEAKQIVWLVGEGTATTSNNSTDGLDGRVKAQKQAIQSTGNLTLGHYAYWVGDESVKANFAVLDPFANPDNTPKSGMEVGTQTYRNRLQVPQRIGWENIPGFGNATFLPNDPKLDEISTTREIVLLEANSPSTSETSIRNVQRTTKQNFHSLTAHSRSLLTDTALGGLKKDLTVFFEGTGSGLNLNSSIADFSLYDPADPRFGGTSNNGFPRNTSSTAGLPRWGELKAWHDNDQSALGPVLAHYQIFTAFTHKNGEVQFHILPLIFLWNPYDVPLTSATYTLEMRHNLGFWFFGMAIQDGVDPTPANLNDGRVITSSGLNFYIPPLTRLGWAAAPGRFGNSFPVNPWDPNPDSNRANPTGTPLAGPPSNSRFTIFDTGSSLPPPTSTQATWVPYRITSSFAPGEVKVFSVMNSQQVDPAALHNGSAAVQLENGYDVALPESYWFTIARGIEKSPGVPAANNDIVRWYGQSLPNNTPPTISVRLKRGANTLWQYLYTGQNDNSRWYRSVNWQPPSIPDTDPNFADRPHTWKRVFHLDDWPNVSKALSDQRSRESPIQAMAGNRILPFTPAGWTLLSGGQLTQGGLTENTRYFANHNPSANVQDPISELEFARATIGNNNADGFHTVRWWVSEFNYSPCNWASNQVDGDNGFALFSWQNLNTSLNHRGLKNLQLRQARADFSLLSLGQLQQVNLSPYSWQPAFPFANSEASPYVDRARAAGLQSYEVRNAKGFGSYILNLNQRPPDTPWDFPNDTQNRFLDISFVLNENLWDRYFLSSIPQSGPINTSTVLKNSRLRLKDSVTSSPTEARNFNLAAAHLDNVGALNVNSTSVESWIGLLTAFRNLAIEGAGQRNPANTVPISRNMAPLQGPINFTDTTRNPPDYGAAPFPGDSNNARRYDKMFQGFRYLTDGQIRRLAERIVDEVRLRGPFLSMADFVNRRLVEPDLSGGTWLQARTSNSSSNLGLTAPIGTGYDPLVGLAGINGALQRALNLSGINGAANYPFADDTNDRVFRVDSDLSNGISGDPMSIYAVAQSYLDTEHRAGVPAGEVGQLLSHSPGFVTQGDLLAMLGPALTPRGDTFLVRSYGDAVDRNGRVLARAWLEAVVQRVVEPVTPAGSSGEARFQPSDKFGRKFKVVNIRWLNPEEV